MSRPEKTRSSEAPEPNRGAAERFQDLRPSERRTPLGHWKSQRQRQQHPKQQQHPQQRQSNHVQPPAPSPLPRPQQPPTSPRPVPPPAASAPPPQLPALDPVAALAADVYNRVSARDLDFIFSHFLTAQQRRGESTPESLDVQRVVLRLVLQHFQMMQREVSPRLYELQRLAQQQQRPPPSAIVPRPLATTAASSPSALTVFVPDIHHGGSSQQQELPEQQHREDSTAAHDQRLALSRRLLKKVSAFMPLPMSLAACVSHPLFRHFLHQKLWSAMLDDLAVDTYPHLRSAAAVDGLYVSKLHSRARGTPASPPVHHVEGALLGRRGQRRHEQYNECPESLALLLDEAWRAGKVLHFDTEAVRYLLPTFTVPATDGSGKKTTVTLRAHVWVDAIHGRQAPVLATGESSALLATLYDLKAQTTRVIEDSRRSRISLDHDHRRLLGAQTPQTYTFDDDEPVPVMTQALSSHYARQAAPVTPRPGGDALRCRPQRGGIGFVAEDTEGCTHVFLDDQSACPPADWLATLCRGDETFAIHLTELQLPWLALQLLRGSGSAVADRIRGLYGHFCEASFARDPVYAAAWELVKRALTARATFTTLCVAPRSSQRDEEQCALEESLLQFVREHTATLVPDVAARSAAGACSLTQLTAGMEWSPSLEVVKLQHVAPEALRALLAGERPRAADGEDARPPRATASADQTHHSRLRQIYYTAEVEGFPRTRPEPLRVRVDCEVLRALQTLWIDCASVRALSFASPDVSALTSLHLLLDARLSGSALSEVERLPSLEVLHVERIHVDDVSFLGRCRHLRQLFLHHCRFAGAADPSPARAAPASAGPSPPSPPPLSPPAPGQPRGLVGIERAPLELLSLSYSSDVRQLTHLAACRTLRHLLLTRCYTVSSSTIAGLHALPLLETLSLEYTRVDSVVAFNECPRLRALNLTGCKRILRDSVRGVEAMPALQELSLSATNVAAVAQLAAGCAALRTLDLSHCVQLDGGSLQSLAALPALEVLCLSHLLVSDVGFVGDCLALRSLVVEGCDRLADEGLRGAERAPALQRLIARECDGLAAVGHLGRCPQLRVLSLEGCAALAWRGLAGLEDCGTLEYLGLARCPLLAGAVPAALGRLPRLRHLDLCGCGGVNDVAALGSLAALRSADLRGLNELASVAPLRACERLQTVAFVGCDQLTSADVAELERKGVMCLR